MCEFGPIFPLKSAGFHPKIPVSEKISWEPGSQVPEENPALPVPIMYIGPSPIPSMEPDFSLTHSVIDPILDMGASQM